MIQAGTNEEKALFVKERLLTGPVLVFGGPTLTEELRKAGCEPIMITKDVDFNLMRGLDSTPYRVLVSESQFGMRGIDYRCQKAQMTLVVA